LSNGSDLNNFAFVSFVSCQKSQNAFIVFLVVAIVMRHLV